MAEEQVRETLQFVTHPRADVRRMAVELLKTLSPAGSESRVILKNQKAAIALAKVATDADPVTAKDASAALVNLTDDRAIVLQLVGSGFIPTLVENVCAKDNKLLSLHVMLLNNITTFEEGCKKVLRCGADEDPQLRGFEALKLFEAFVQSGQGATAAEDALGWLGSVLQNLAQIPEGRVLFCDPSKNLLARIAPFIRHTNPLRRRGSIGLIKNCLFNDLCHAQALSDETRILANAMLALAPLSETGEIFTADDRNGMPAEVLRDLDDKQRKRETDLTNKKLLLESLLLLTKTKAGRETLRQKKLYPIIREMHREDENQMTESMTDTIGKLVECLQLPEGVEEPKKQAKVEEIEEIV